MIIVNPRMPIAELDKIADDAERFSVNLNLAGHIFRIHRRQGVGYRQPVRCAELLVQYVFVTVELLKCLRFVPDSLPHGLPGEVSGLVCQLVAVQLRQIVEEVSHHADRPFKVDDLFRFFLSNFASVTVWTLPVGVVNHGGIDVAIPDSDYGGSGRR